MKHTGRDGKLAYTNLGFREDSGERSKLEIETGNHRDFPGGTVIKNLHFHCRGDGVRALVRELRSCMPRGEAKKEKRKVGVTDIERERLKHDSGDR